VKPNYLYKISLKHSDIIKDISKFCVN